MPRVIGIDPGTVSIDVCGIDDERVFLDRSLATRDVLDDPSGFLAVLEASAPLDLVAGPSGYGLPLRSVRDLTDREYRLAFLGAPGETGGLGGLRALVKALGHLTAPVVLTPGVIHLASVPPHRKINRVDMGTADKVCAAALAIQDQSRRCGCEERETSFILLELGGAFTAALAVDGGRIVDGIGGTSGPIGWRASGALDGEVAYLAGSISKHLLFAGGAASVAGDPDLDLATLDTTPISATHVGSARASIAVAVDVFVEGAVKAVAALTASVPQPHEIILSGRGARIEGVRADLVRRLARAMPNARVHVLDGFASVAKQSAQGAALIADGLAGGRSAGLVETLGIRAASGTVLDHLHVIDPDAARRRLGIG